MDEISRETFQELDSDAKLLILYEMSKSQNTSIKSLRKDFVRIIRHKNRWDRMAAIIAGGVSGAITVLGCIYAILTFLNIKVPL